jgi:RimJ/RimL family protein N-acetyltransferase
MTRSGPAIRPLIRPARPEDFETCAQIAKRAWAPIVAERGAVMGEDLMRRERGDDPLEAKAEDIRRVCAAHPDCVLVTELAGRVVGFITFHADPDKGILTIGNNAIDPEYQGRGLGTAQCEHVLTWARENGFAYAKVVTGLDDCHAAARAAYRKVGFDIAIPGVTYYRKL